MGMLDLFKGKPTKKVGRRSYYGANTGRLFADFISSSRSADSEIRPSLRILRDRCREISRNHPYAKRYLQIMATNVVGDTGVQMQVRKRNDDNSLDTVGNRLVERAFAAWGRPGFCTADRRLSWVQAQRLFIETLARDGEAVPKYCTSTSRCLRPRSWKAIQPMVMPQPPHGLERAPTLSPLS